LFFLFIGSIFFVVFSINSDFKCLYYFNNRLNNSTGTIDAVTETNFSFNDTKILKYEYHFLANNKTKNGSSYSSKSTKQIGDIVNIEYVITKPSMSRIYGMTNAPYSLYVFGITLLFPLFGLTLVWFDFKKLKKYNNILKDYLITRAELEFKEKTSIEINDQPLYKLKYIYKHLNKRYQNISSSSEPETHLNSELLIYSKPHPNDSVLIKKLPIHFQEEIKKVFNTMSN